MRIRVRERRPPRLATRLAGLLLVAAAAGVAAAGSPAAGPAPSRGPARAPRSIRLTFDADMTPGMLKRLRAGRVSSWYDPAIVEYLRGRRVPATIFVTGLFAETYPDFVASLARDPLFTVGAHGYRHAAYTAGCYGLPHLKTDAEKLDDLARARDAIARISGRAPTLFRFPGLCHGAHDDELVVEAGMKVDDAAVVASGDAFTHDADAVVRQVMRGARAGQVLVFHLGGPNAPVTREVIEKIVPALTARGFEFGSE